MNNTATTKPTARPNAALAEAEAAYFARLRAADIAALAEAEAAYFARLRAADIAANAAANAWAEQDAAYAAHAAAKGQA